MQNIGFSDSCYVTKPPQPSSTIYLRSSAFHRAPFVTSNHTKFSLQTTNVIPHKHHLRLMKNSIRNSVTEKY